MIKYCKIGREVGTLMVNSDPTTRRDYSVFDDLRLKGATPVEVCRAAAKQGLDNIEQIKMVRSVFRICLAEVKEIKLVADGIDPEAHWNMIRESLKQAEEDGLFD